MYSLVFFLIMVDRVIKKRLCYLIYHQSYQSTNLVFFSLRLGQTAPMKQFNSSTLQRLNNKETENHKKSKATLLFVSYPCFFVCNKVL